MPLKWSASSISSASAPTVSVTAWLPASAPGACGLTVTSKLSPALPLPFTARTVTLATPGDSGVSASRPPDSQTCTTPPGTAVAS